MKLFKWLVVALATLSLLSIPAHAGGGKSRPASSFSIKGRIKEAGLPHQGKIRYVPPKGYSASAPLPRGQRGGFLDRKLNEWVKGPSRTHGEKHEWDVQLSRQGKSSVGWASRDQSHLNVSLKGRITHK